MPSSNVSRHVLWRRAICQRVVRVDVAYNVDLDLGAKIRGAELGAIDLGTERKYLYTPPFLPRGSIHSFTIFSVSFSTPTRQTIRIEKLGLGNSDLEPRICKSKLSSIPSYIFTHRFGIR